MPRNLKERFKRVSPAFFSEKVGILPGWFVISSRYIPNKSERRLKHGRWFKLSTSKGTVYRILRFSPNLIGSPGKEGDIVIDWIGWIDLCGREEDVKDPLEIEITEVRFWEWPKLPFSHPDPVYRLASLLGFISAFLGALSLVLAGWALWKTYNP